MQKAMSLLPSNAIGRSFILIAVVCIVIVSFLLMTKFNTARCECDKFFNVDFKKQHSVDALSGLLTRLEKIVNVHSDSENRQSIEAPFEKKKGNEIIVFQRDVFNASKLSSYPIGPENKANKDKYFIYRCDEATMCGGWADRIRGVFVSYLIANLTGRTFKMEMLFASCDVHRFLVPNQVDWYQPVPIHKVVKTGNGVATMNMVDNNNFISNIETDFMTMPSMQSKYVYFKGNREVTMKFQALVKYKQQLRWMEGITYAEMNNALFRHLFKPSLYLQNKAKSFLAENLRPGEKLICAHVRYGKSSTMPNDYGPRFDISYLPNVWNFLGEKTKRNDSKIFFMTDSEDIIAKTKGQSFKDKLFFSPGQLVHIDRSPGMSAKVKCDGLERVIFEQFILMHCDVLMIAQSGISRAAAYVRNTDKGLFCFLNSGVIVPCKRSEIRETYNIKI